MAFMGEPCPMKSAGIREDFGCVPLTYLDIVGCQPCTRLKPVGRIVLIRFVLGARIVESGGGDKGPRLRERCAVYGGSPHQYHGRNATRWRGNLVADVRISSHRQGHAGCCPRYRAAAATAY